MRKLVLALLIAGCTVEGGKDVPLVQGGGAVAVDPATQQVKLDPAQVPDSPGYHQYWTYRIYVR